MSQDMYSTVSVAFISLSPQMRHRSKNSDSPMEVPADSVASVPQTSALPFRMILRVVS